MIPFASLRLGRSVRNWALALGMTMGLAACATPHLQGPMTPPVGFSGPMIQQDSLGRGAFVVQDGARLPYLRWSPQGEAPWAVIIALHGFNDHKASFRMAGPWWAEKGIETWAYDQRGFGLGPNRGEFASESLTSEDLRTVVALVRAQRPGALIVVAGESMGGATAISAFGSERPPQADRVILLGPAVWGWSSQSPLNRAALQATARLMGEKAVQAPEFATRRVSPTDNLAELVRMGHDPEVTVRTRFDALYGLVELMEVATQRLGRVEAPTLLLYGATDHLVKPRPMRLALEKAGDRPNLRTAWYPDGWHILNRDLQAEVVFADIEAWLKTPQAPLPSGVGDVLETLNRGH